MSPGSLSRREFAAQVGCSPTVIRRLCKRGVLPVDGHDRIPMPEGLRAFLAVRSVHAPATPPAASGEPATAAPPHRHADVIAVELKRKELAAQTAELRYKRESGELVPRAEVAAEAQAVCGAIRAALLSIPARVALLVEALVASSDAQLRAGRIQRLLEDEVNLALEALQAAAGRGEP